MMIATICPHCSENFNTSDKNVGQMMKCPNCLMPFRVQPVGDEEPADEALSLEDEEQIQTQCPTCQQQFTVAKSFNGQRIKCPTCYEPFVIADQHAVMVHPLGTESAAVAQEREPPVIVPRVSLSASPRVSHAAPAPHARPVEHAPVPTGSGDVPFALKGNRLGMSLPDFQTQNHRPIEGSRQSAPFCSDEENGMVNCRLDYPAERDAGRAPPTIAGLPTDSLLFQFVDGQLYQIAGVLDGSAYDPLVESLTMKYGTPDELDSGGFAWHNSSSAIMVYLGNSAKASAQRQVTHIKFIHTALFEQAERRKSKQTKIGGFEVGLTARLKNAEDL